MISVLDTTALSAAMRDEPAMVRFLETRRPGDVAVTPVTVAEIRYGIHRLEPGSRKRSALEREADRLLGAIAVLAWTDEASRRFGSIKAGLERSGQLIDDLDIAIAAIAMAHGGQVVTANLTQFRRVPDLPSVHWEGGSSS